MKLRFLLALLGASALLGGCEVVECYDCYPHEPTTITVSGYGAPDPTLGENRPQQVLMAMRASEVDAFRTLAEQIKGVEVTSGSRVDDYVTRYDNISAQVNTFVLQNARINSQSMTNGGYYETSLSLTLGPRFYRIFTNIDRHPSRYHYRRQTVITTRSTRASHYHTTAEAAE